MLLSKLAGSIEYELIGADIDVSGIEYHSAHVVPGVLFCCIRGFASDGHDFAAKAIDAGAAALLVEHRLPFSVPQIIVGDSREAMADMAAEFYGHPAKSMTMVGVTGTNGKTSTTYMLKAIAERMGKKVGLIGTIRNMIGDEMFDTERTTPESADLQRMLRTMADRGAEIVFMEVSSHSLDQKRVHGITFDVGLFTNLTQDHLDYHKTFENYLAAKKRLFYQSRFGVFNADDGHTPQFLDGLTIPYSTFGIREPADVCASDIEIDPQGVSFEMHYGDGTLEMRIPMPGLFSVFNALGAGAAAFALGFPPEMVKAGLEGMGRVSGRLEPLQIGDRPFSVILDYAHTPDALENIITAVRGFAKGRVITVFGCGGGRDKAKRPIMGEIAGRLSDYIVVTSDNPRNEEPMDIINSVVEGVMKSGCTHAVIENRREAIKFALLNGRENDVIIIAGKGHETYQEISGVKHHFDDKEVVAELLKELG